MMKPLTAAALKAMAKELQIKDWWNKKKEVLLQEVSEARGCGHESPPVQEFLLQGGEIKSLPGFEGIAPKPTREDSAMTARKKPVKKTPVKKTPAKKATPKKVESTGGLVTLGDLCKELGVEGRVARRKLRGSEIEKPGAQWAWEEGSKELNSVIELLK